jgi:hypothetical protein
MNVLGILGFHVLVLDCRSSLGFYRKLGRCRITRDTTIRIHPLHVGVEAEVDIGEILLGYELPVLALLVVIDGLQL